MVRGLRAGARGYLLKDTSRQTLFDNLRAAARGEVMFTPQVLERLMVHAASQNRRGVGEKAGLTDRELEVLSAVANGQRSKEIAVQLGISERTVKAHLASIYSKLGVDSRAAAIAVAAQRGLLRGMG
jgi:NarL family two-component system response regulator YdfI